jgi:thiol-disulfide isomerase/thioredoxin
MISLRIIFALAFALFFTTAALSQEQIQWMTDLDDAKRLALQTGKPLMYDFTAKWCGPCRRMEQVFWPKPEVVKMSKQFVCVKVDFDREKSLAGKYGINAIPNVVFTDPWGRGLLGQRGFGAGSEEEIFEKIRILPKDFSTLIEAGNALENDSKDVKALHKFAAFYQERKFFWLGNEFYKRLVKLEADPDKREAIFLNLAFNHIRLGEPGEAIEKFEILQKEFPKSPQNDGFLYGIIYASVRKNKVQNAKKYLAELKEKFPSSKFIEPAERAIAEAGEDSKK